MQLNVLFTMFKKEMYFRLNATEPSVSICANKIVHLALSL